MACSQAPIAKEPSKRELCAVAQSRTASETVFGCADARNNSLPRSVSIASTSSPLDKCIMGVKRSCDDGEEDAGSASKRAKDSTDDGAGFLLAGERLDGDVWSWGRRLHEAEAETGAEFEGQESQASEASEAFGWGGSDTEEEGGEERNNLQQRRDACAASAPGPLVVTEADEDLIDMLRHLRTTEEQLRPSPSYMDRHSGTGERQFIDTSMRTITISWLVEVACEYGLHQETLHSATSLFDRFLSVAKAVPRTNLQLVGVACMLVAAKHEEELHPSVADFTSIADNSFPPSDLIHVESLVLDALDFRLNTPTAYHFLSLYCQGIRVSPKCTALAVYFTELAMLDYSFLHYAPSKVAAAAVLLAAVYDGCNSAALFDRLGLLCGHQMSTLSDAMEDLAELHQQAFDAVDHHSPFMSLKDKFRDAAWQCASLVRPFDTEDIFP